MLASSGNDLSIALVDAGACRIEAGLNLGGDANDTVTFTNVSPLTIKPAPKRFDQTSLMLMGASCAAFRSRARWNRCSTSACDYSNERVAFEKKISKFQAVQHNLARLAGESAAALAAATSAADTLANASSFDDAVFLEAAAAKIRCSEAAEKGGAIAHQVHGAIGFTIEHILHRYTLRALAWRDDFGSESYWAVNLANWSPRAAPTNCGRWWPRADIQTACTGSRDPNMTAALRFDPIRLPPECEKLRQEVRAFLAEEIAAGTFDPHQPNREDSDAPEFSRRVGERGWLGMTWPKKYGGHERTFLERYVVTEEMRVANAPTRRFFVADRQSGPVLLKYAPEHIKMDILPRICRGEVCFAIGMSEPNSGSDLFAAKTKATKTDGGWLINGTKIWTSSAHIADYMIAIFRTSPSTKENRRHGLTQFLVDMKTPGIKVNPIGQITGQFEFNEVVFTDAFMPDDHVLGEIDGAWKQATSELAYERSGPERFLETYYVLTELVRAVGSKPDTRSAEGIGRLVAQLHTMRRMSVSVAGMLQAGKEPVVEASIVKDIGTVWEQQLPHRVRDLAAFVDTEASNHETLENQLSFAIKTAPKLTIQGGTTEVLRGIIARGLGLR